MKKWLKEKKETSDKIEKIEKVDNYKIKDNADWIKAKSDVDLNIENNYFQMVDARSRTI